MKKKIFVLAFFLLFNILNNYSLATEYNINFLDDKSIYTKEECIEIIKNINELQVDEFSIDSQGNQYYCLRNAQDKNIFRISHPIEIGKNTNKVVIAGKKELIQDSYNALKYLNNNNIKNSPEIYSYFNNQNKYYLVYSFIEGIEIKNIYLNYENRQIINQIFKILLEVEKIFFTHKDLNSANIIYNYENNEVNIIDFNSYAIERQFINYLIDEPKNTIHVCNTENPLFSISSNIPFFESCYLINYFLEYELDNPIIKYYLKEKSKFIKKRLRHYKKFSKQIKNKDDKTSLRWNKIFKIENSIANVLGNPSCEIIEYEIQKIKVRELVTRRDQTIIKKIIQDEITRDNIKNSTQIELKKMEQMLEKIKTLPKNKDLDVYISVQEELYKDWYNFENTQ